MACAEDLILKAISHATVAGALRAYGRTDERSAAGLNKAADQHSLLAERALTEWADAVVTLAGPPLAERILQFEAREGGREAAPLR
jgi:hypothetical protein